METSSTPHGRDSIASASQLRSTGAVCAQVEAAWYQRVWIYGVWYLLTEGNFDSEYHAVGLCLKAQKDVRLVDRRFNLGSVNFNK